jgi:hypothetical protein
MSLPIFTMGPWRAEDGDARHPRELAGAAVEEVICTRDEEPAALVMLADGRYALTGERLVVGSARQLKLYVGRQLRQGLSENDWAWFVEIADALARRSPRPFRLVGIRRPGRAPGNSRPRRRTGPVAASKVRALSATRRRNGNVLRIARRPPRQRELSPGPGDPA